MQPDTQQPHVTILMLTYNRAPFIRAAIDSALAQTFTHFTLVILDDGSTDETPSIVATYTDERIRYIRNDENKGLYARRKESLSYVTGDYAAILDSDDIWTDPEKLAKQVAYLEANPECVVVGTAIHFIDASDSTIGHRIYPTTDQAIRRSLLIRTQFANPSVLMRTSALVQTQGYQPYAPTEDLELFLQLGMIGTFANLPDDCVGYRVHPGGESFAKVKNIPIVLAVIRLHRHAYPYYWLGRLRYTLSLLLARWRTRT